MTSQLKSPPARGATGRRRAPSFLTCILGLFLWRAGAGAECAAAELRVAVVSDGPAQRELVSVQSIQSELPGVLAPGVQIIFPDRSRYVGDWSAITVREALQRALADNTVDAVLALGPLAAHAAGQIEAPPKPVIAPLAVDPALERFPLAEGRSGRHNFSYVDMLAGLEPQVRAFRGAVAFNHLSILVDDMLLAELPELRTRTAALSTAIATPISVLAMGTDAKATLAALPDGTDAVLLAGTQRLDNDRLQALAAELQQRRLPSFALAGSEDLQAGLLMSAGDWQGDRARLARRVALMLQRIALGEDPARFEVEYETDQRLTINMRTAQAIGYAPTWRVLADARAIGMEPVGTSDTLSIASAVQAALTANPSLAAAGAVRDSARDEVGIARSNLLPTLGLSGTRTRIDADRASSIGQAEDSSSVAASAQQLLYSESAWAAYGISKLQASAADQGLQRELLDTMEQAAKAYVNVRRAVAVEAVRRASVENSRKNLQIGQARESVGLAGHSDYLRWVAQLDRDKRSLLSAQSNLRQAEIELARVLHREPQDAGATSDAGLDQLIEVIADPANQSLFDTPDRWRRFAARVVDIAINTSPEIRQAGSEIASRQRAVDAARRAFFLPDIALLANGSSIVDRQGVGAVTVPGAPDDRSWSVSVQATLPVFTGGLRRAKYSQAQHQLKAAESDAAAVRDTVAARTRATLESGGSSWPGIALAREAAAAADQNLAMVTDAYARGAVSVTDLIDAQDAALSADLGATEARYDFLGDFIGIERALGSFEVLLDPAKGARWLHRIVEDIR